jgi:hypothetical protein
MALIAEIQMHNSFYKKQLSLRNAEKSFVRRWTHAKCNGDSRNMLQERSPLQEIVWPTSIAGKISAKVKKLVRFLQANQLFYFLPLG